MKKSKYLIQIYGKKNCPKCDSLKKRIHTLLKDNQYPDFQTAYYDVTTEEGLFQFAKAETINGQRIPALQILRYNQLSQKYEKILDPRKEEIKNGKLFIPVYLQLETDYSNPGQSVIKPEDILSLMTLADKRSQ